MILTLIFNNINLIIIIITKNCAILDGSGGFWWWPWRGEAKGPFGFTKDRTGVGVGLRLAWRLCGGTYDMLALLGEKCILYKETHFNYHGHVFHKFISYFVILKV
jgi:hypothetical protein